MNALHSSDIFINTDMNSLWKTMFGHKEKDFFTQMCSKHAVGKMQMNQTDPKNMI